MLSSTLDVSHRCTSCANYSRDGLSNFFCAIHPFGVGVDAGTRNTCPDWQAADSSLILHQIAAMLSTHPRTQEQSWRIVQLVQPPKQVLYAVVQVEQQVQIWAVYQLNPYNSTTPDLDVVVEEWQGFSRSLDRDAPYMVWTNSVGTDADRPLFPVFCYSHRSLKTFLPTNQDDQRH